MRIGWVCWQIVRRWQEWGWISRRGLIAAVGRVCCCCWCGSWWRRLGGDFPFIAFSKLYILLYSKWLWLRLKVIWKWEVYFMFLNGLAGKDSAVIKYWSWMRGWRKTRTNITKHLAPMIPDINEQLLLLHPKIQERQE